MNVRFTMSLLEAAVPSKFCPPQEKKTLWYRKSKKNYFLNPEDGGSMLLRKSRTVYVSKRCHIFRVSTNFKAWYVSQRPEC
jgi:hypothetical protein